MEQMMKINGVAEAESIDALSLAIQNVFIQGYNCHVESSVLKVAITTLRDHAVASPISVHSCSMHNTEA